MSDQLSWRYQRLRSLVQRARTSLALRGWKGTLARISQGLGHQPAEADDLHLLPVGEAYGRLALPVYAAPVVSIIIPVHGKLDYTLACLQSIANHPPQAPFEVIVVNDASPDNTAAVLRNVAGLRVVTNPVNLGFVGAGNAGAAAALGQTLLFLNNDTQVTDGWADALLRAFEIFPGTGIAGSQLIYPDGRLQEAGAFIFADGSAWNIGRFESRKHPAYRFSRAVDYVSGASLAIPATVFRELGGFDTRYAPGYYEDADLALAARQAGHEVRYVADSMVVHTEGVSSAGEGSAALKQFQSLNQQKLATKWRDALRAQPEPGEPLAAIDARRFRGVVLVIDVATPDASRDSGSLRIIAMMRILVNDGWRVVFAPDDGKASDREIGMLGSYGIEVAVRPSTSSIPAWLAAHGAQLQAAILCRHTVAAQYERFVRKHAPQARFIFDTVDLHFLREERAAEQAGNANLHRQAQSTRRQELELISRADTTFVVSQYERELLASLVPSAHVDLLSNIHEVYGRAVGFGGRKDLLFVGGYGHPPNADAMHWMASEILPALRKVEPSLRVFVAGDVPAAARDELARAGLDMLGRVGDLAPLMARCLASIAPLRFGAGVKGKINMSMSHGLPVIGTPIAVEGMQLVTGRDVLVAASPEDFAAAYRCLADDESLWLALSDASIDNVRRHFSGEAAREALSRAVA